jgi:hypothetical protein
MSTTPQTPAQQPGEPLSRQNEIRIVSHSTLFYWWPVWAICLIMALLTWIDGHYMTVVPAESRAGKVKGPAKVTFEDDTTVPLKDHYIVVTKEQKNPERERIDPPRLRMARNKNLGVIFCTILLLVIFITNVPLRGLWSVIVIVVIIFTSIIFGLLGWWKNIVEAIEILDIHINMAGYVVIGVVLLAMWLITLFLFDQQIYMVFTPGQLRVRLEIGEGETAYDTRGMTIQKQRSDLFRHWILGLGSGDLIVNTSGAQVHHFDLPNVLFVGRKVKEIEEMLRSMPVVRSAQ